MAAVAMERTHRKALSIDVLRDLDRQAQWGLDVHRCNPIFQSITQDGLDWALDKQGLLGDEALRERLLALYWELSAYPEVPAMLAALKEAGAEGVIAYVTHGVLSGGAVARVEGSVLTELVITDSIGNHESIGATSKIRHLPIAPLLGEAIKRIADETSVSSLFD